MSREVRALGPLGRRILATFLAVSLSATGLVAVLAMRTVQTETVGLAAGQRARAEQAIVAALADAFHSAGSWERADLSTARALAQAAGLQVVVLDATGGPIARLEPTTEPTTRQPATPTPSPGSGTPGAGTPRTSGTGTPGTGPPGTGTPAAVPSGTGTSGTGTSGTRPSGTGTPGGGPAPAASGPGAEAPPPTSGSGAGHATVDTARVTTGRWDQGEVRAWRADPLPTARPLAMLVAVRTGTGSETDATTGRPGGAATSGPAPAPGIPVVVDGRTVGRALIEPAPRLAVPAEVARAAILRTVGWGALAAGVLAVLISLLATRRIIRPLLALAEAARAVERGDPDAARQLPSGPGELGTVSAAFATMARTVRRTDELRRAMAADVAHELRTPVTILRGGTEQLLDGVAPLTREAVASLHEEVLRLERLVEDLAALSAAEAAGLSLRMAPVDLGGLARRAVAQVRPRLAERSLTVAVTVDDEPPPLLVDGDADRLTQVITNLLVNAITHSPPGGRIDLGVRRRGDRIALTVADTGRGIAPAVLPHVFERFYRGPAAGGPGTGIGLAVVAELVSAHAGTVTADSPPGRGAVFTVLLPPPDGAHRAGHR